MLNKQDKILILVIIAVSFVIYANSFQGQIFWDGYFEIINNQYVKEFQVDKFFTKSLFAGAGEHDNFYRPIGLLTYATDYRIWRLNPFGFHLTNVILQTLTAVLVYLFFSLVGSKRPVSFLTALIFTVHPFNIEITTYINGRHELLSVFFLLLALIFLSLFSLKEKNKNIYYLFSLASIGLAMLSKESAIIYPVLLFLAYFVFLKKEEGLRKVVLKMAPFFGISFAYASLRLSVINFGVEIADKGRDVFTHSLSFLKAILVYWRVLLLPYDPHLRLAQSLSFGIWEIALSGLILVIMLYFSVRSLRSGSNILFFGFAWFFISLLPVSGIFIDVKYALGERWLHLAAIGPLFLIALGLDKFFRENNKKNLNNFLVICLGVYVAWLALVVVRTNQLWKDQITYFEYLLKIYPEDLETHVNLGVAYDEKGRKEDAFREYKKAIELDPKVFNVHANLGAYYAEKKQYGLAISEYKKTIVLNNSFTYAYQALAQIYAGQGNYNKAIRILKRLAEILPDSWKSYSLLGDAYLMKGDKPRAVESYKKGLEVDSDNEHLKEKLRKLGTI